MGGKKLLEIHESFSKRDIEILGLIRDGLSNQDIARQLFLSLATVKWYNHQIFDKLGVSNRVQAVQKAVELGLFKEQVAFLAKGIPSPGHNLPIAIDSFIGRQDEISALLDLLSMQRLVTLTGPGGVGKTRLALQVGWELREYFADGIFFVNLAATHEANLVPHVIATTIGLHEFPGRSMQELLQEHLAQKRLLLILDNFEQVLDAGQQIYDLLLAAPNLKILVTSREILHLTGEQVFSLNPLPLPAKQINRQEILDGDAVQLFVQRALAMRYDLEISEETALAVLAICRKLDGLPLAIELAATRVGIFNPQSILAQLDNRLRVLVDGKRDKPTRQHTLRASIEWSYDLLNIPEQTLFQRLSIFAGGCTLEAAETVCGEDGLDAQQMIESLLDKHLLMRREVEGETHFGMYETIREYALERLGRSGEVLTIRHKYAEYYAAYRERFFMEINRLEMEIQNFRTVLRWSIDAGQPEAAYTILSHTWFWSERNSEYRFWMDNLLSSPGAQPASQGRSVVVFHACLQANIEGDIPRFRKLLDEQIALAEALDSRVAQIDSSYLSGYLHILIHDYEGAADAFAQGLTASQHGFDASHKWEYQFRIAIFNNGLGNTYLLMRNFDRAETTLQKAFVLFSNPDIKFPKLETLTSLGYVSIEKQAYPQAIKFFTQSLAESVTIGFKAGYADCMNGLAVVAQKQGNLRRAARLYSAVARFTFTQGLLSHEPPLLIINQSYQAALRQQLDPADLERARQEGLQMSLEEALGYAMQMGEDNTA